MLLGPSAVARAQEYIREGGGVRAFANSSQRNSKFLTKSVRAVTDDPISFEVCRYRRDEPACWTFRCEAEALQAMFLPTTSGHPSKLRVSVFVPHLHDEVFSSYSTHYINQVTT
jgi:hypothetical protein